MNIVAENGRPWYFCWNNASFYFAGSHAEISSSFVLRAFGWRGRGLIGSTAGGRGAARSDSRQHEKSASKNRAPNRHIRVRRRDFCFVIFTLHIVRQPCFCRIAGAVELGSRPPAELGVRRGVLRSTRCKRNTLALLGRSCRVPLPADVSLNAPILAARVASTADEATAVTAMDPEMSKNTRAPSDSRVWAYILYVNL